MEIPIVNIVRSSLLLDDHNFIWYLEFMVDFLLQMHAVHSQHFADIPYRLLVSCLEHPYLTVDRLGNNIRVSLYNYIEMHLAEALSIWIDYNQRQVVHAGGCEYDFTDLLKHIRVSILPLSFAAGKRKSNYLSDLAYKSVQAIHSMKNPSVDWTDSFENDDFSHLRLRLTEYSEMVDLSGCPQITSALLFFSMLPYSYCMESMDPLLRNSFKESLRELDGVHKYSRLFSLQVLPVLCFEAVHKVDISKCLGLNIADAMQCFSKSFPSLRILKAAYLLNFEASDLPRLLEKCPLLIEVDLTHDTSPIPLAHPSPAMNPTCSCIDKNDNFEDAVLIMTPRCYSRFPKSNIARLTLEGRSDVRDDDLIHIANNCSFLCYLNLKGCSFVSDAAICYLLWSSLHLHALIVCDTRFGNNSVKALCCCGRVMTGTLPYPPAGWKNSDWLACKLQILHMGGCKGVDPGLLLRLMSRIKSVKSLCLRDTQLDDDALSSFPGSSLDSLDVSNTMISQSHLACIIRKNPGLKILKARGCKSIVQADSNCGRRLAPPSLPCEEVFIRLGNSCKLQEIALGWGFSSLALEALKPAITALSSLTVGLGGSLGEDALRQLPTICPNLESLTLYFQVLSDGIMSNILASLRHLKVLELCFCSGDISILSFKFSMPHLRKLGLQRVAASMTHDDLLVLARNCPNLTELCLVGCRRLSSDAQEIISREWPGLTYLHLEECGEVTRHGASSLFDCAALEVLFLRHNGRGIEKSFILDAVSKLPMLRQLSVDTCDAREGRFSIPKRKERQSFSAIKIARCQSRIRSLDIQSVKQRRWRVHRDTLVYLRDERTITEERL
ncbi:BTB/POZ domain-containing protein FBL11-like [Punica granatum]|uniref:BTB/POZ domain-containing protein FBL11-like n=1 Tax=Punica granatum TaxID=22663 RepID=A0A6P8CAK5_PUNGR|nr:BTB/POZ domain-containing protein FBL11-like [Punica granatum]